MGMVFDPKNPRAVEVARFLEASGAPEKLSPEITLVIGGDGFMLRTVRERYRPDAVFLGINCGRLGFLLNDLPARLEELPDLILSDRLRIRTFPRIQMVAQDAEGRSFEARGLNDVYLQRAGGHGCHLKIWINGVVVVEHMVCDGLIFCTSLGSTAYSFSAGASPCHPSLDVLGVTPICPHAPRLPPLYVPLASTVEAHVINPELRPVTAVVDGYEYGTITRVLIQDGQEPVRLAFFPGHHFTKTLVSKLLIT